VLLGEEDKFGDNRPSEGMRDSSVTLPGELAHIGATYGERLALPKTGGLTEPRQRIVHWAVVGEGNEEVPRGMMRNGDQNGGRLPKARNLH